MISIQSSLPLNFTTIGNPIQPTTRILAGLGPPGAPCELGRRTAPHAGFAVEDHLGVFWRAGVAESIFEFVFADVEAIWLSGYGDVDRPWDSTRVGEFGWFAGIYIIRRRLSVDMVYERYLFGGFMFCS